MSDTGIEPATSSVSGKRATAAPIAQNYEVVWRWRRDSNPCKRLCRPVPSLSATPPSWLPPRVNDVTHSLERTTRFELATPTLARLCATSCATSAFVRIAAYLDYFSPTVRASPNPATARRVGPGIPRVLRSARAWRTATMTPCGGGSGFARAVREYWPHGYG